MAAFLEYDGIKGSVTAGGYQGWSEVTSIAWEIERKNVFDGDGGHAKTAPTVSGVTFTRMSDEATPAFAKEAMVGRGRKAKLEFATTGDKIQPYLTFEFEGAAVVSFQLHADQQRPTETMTLVFATMELIYTSYDEKGNPRAPIPVGYDAVTGRVH